MVRHAQDFALRDANNEAVSLRDFRGSPVVFIFYPLDWSPTCCSDQLSLYQSELSEFAGYGAKLLAISVDSIYSHGAWAAWTFGSCSLFSASSRMCR